MGWLDHKAVKIIKGIGKTPGDNNSAENDPVVVNLLSNLITLAPDGWSPNIPATKNGGVWADSPVSDGRQLIAAAAGNVTEKMTVIITDNSYLGMIKAYLGLNKMAQDCRAYWEAQAQIDPVYLVWFAGCGAGEQYALIYNIELAPEYVDGAQPTIRVSVTIEREPYWRGIPPGANPKIWSYYVNSAHPQFNSGVASLVTGSDHLITQTIQNKSEWSPTAFGLQNTYLSQNFIPISASQVPGDAPALVEMALSFDVASPMNIYFGRSTKKLDAIAHDSIHYYQAYVLNGGDSGAGAFTKTAAIASTGVLSNGSAVNYFFLERTTSAADGNYQTGGIWGQNTANGIKLDRQLLRGTFAIFARCHNTSAAAVITDMQVRILVQEYEEAANQYITTFTGGNVYVPLAAASGIPIAYLGTVTIPFNNRGVKSVLGYGTQIQESLDNIRIILQQQMLVATANRQCRIVDVFLMPLDETLIQIAATSGVSSVGGATVFDNTGYLGSGESQQISLSYVTNAITGGASNEVRGTDLTLVPHTDQRLYFLSENGAGSNNGGRPDQNITVRLNIVPRWSGIRDV